MEAQAQDNTEYSKQYVEAQKVVFDYIKHITTLDTGAVILLTTLLDKFFTHPMWKFLVVSTLTGFVVSIITLTFAAFGIIRSIRTPLDITPGLVKFTSWNFILGITGFVVGNACLAVFAVKNWK